MNKKEIQKAWNTINLFTGHDYENESNIINSIIRYPKYIYRYRMINSKNLDMLEKNILYFSSADHYNDIHDTSFYFDVNKTLFELNKKFEIMNKDLSGTQKKLEKYFQMKISKHDIQLRVNNKNIFYTIISIMNAMRKLLRSNMQSICFSDTWKNYNLWSNYADSHRGFVLCFNTEDCFLDKNIKLFPIYYTEETYDAKDLIINVIAYTQTINSSLSSELKSNIMKHLYINPWDWIKVSILKKLDYETEKEWRIINLKPNKKRDYICLRPEYIILGEQINENDMRRVIESAKKAHITKIYKAYKNISVNDELTFSLLPDYSKQNIIY